LLSEERSHLANASRAKVSYHNMVVYLRCRLTSENACLVSQGLFMFQSLKLLCCISSKSACF